MNPNNDIWQVKLSGDWRTLVHEKINYLYHEGQLRDKDIHIEVEKSNSLEFAEFLDIIKRFPKLKITNVLQSNNKNIIEKYESDSSEESTFGKIGIFYHCWLKPDSLNIYNEQIKLITQSKLNESAAFKCAGVIAKEKYQNLFNQNLFDKVCFSENEKRYEFLTMELLYDWCIDNPDAFVAYFHSKGASYGKSPLPWRDKMNEKVISDWKWCCKLLKQGYDTVGPFYIESDGTRIDYPIEGKLSNIYAGNFWWAKASHILKLPDPRTLNQEVRWSSEIWICLLKHKFFCNYLHTIHNIF